MPLEVLQDKERLQSLKQTLHQHSVPAAGALIERKENGAVQCFACGHRCTVLPGRDGVCRVRFNENGTLLVPHGYVGALACDPIEKKPFFHVLPGSDALDIRHARLRLPLRLLPELGDEPDASRSEGRRSRGCVRQSNWLILPSSTVRRSWHRATTNRSSPANGRSMCSRKRVCGICGCAYISNGNGTPQVLDFLRPHIEVGDLDGIRAVGCR